MCFMWLLDCQRLGCATYINGWACNQSSRVVYRLLHMTRLKPLYVQDLSDEGLWLQGLPAMGLEREAMRSILMEVAELAAYSSVIVGELPQMTRSEAEDLLGEAGMLGTLQPESRSSSSSPNANR